VLPALILLYFIYRQDRIEKEPIGLLAKLFIVGGLMTIPAGIAESFFIPIAARILAPGGVTTAFLLVENFLIIALAEEGFKRLAMKRLTWRHPAFNYPLTVLFTESQQRLVLLPLKM
jgi:RsiW-degrading membrane proteinase PrsW (M82 family)